jgi:hypothetical protein
VCVLGLGLIGGSLMRAAAAAGRERVALRGERGGALVPVIDHADPGLGTRVEEREDVPAAEREDRVDARGAEGARDVVAAVRGVGRNGGRGLGLGGEVRHGASWEGGASERIAALILRQIPGRSPRISPGLPLTVPAALLP